MSARLDAPGVTLQSFRDPGGNLLRIHDRILRVVEPDYARELDVFLRTRFARAAMDEGRLVRTVRVDSPEILGSRAGAVYEHERISFPSYPYEWPPEMLYAAAKATIDFALEALEHGYGLKDANPYNVLFRGAQPVFVDILSFEHRDPLDPVWRAYGQMVRTFLLPLLAQKSFGMPLQQTLLGKRDGLEPEVLYECAGWWKRLTPPSLGLVSLPKWMGGNGKEDASTYRARQASSQEQAKFILEGLLKRARKQLESVAPRTTDSTWSDYLDSKSQYSSEQLAQKERFFREAIDYVKPHTMLDVGANEGHFSFLAARQGASVVAIDTDPVVVGSVWKRAAKENLDVLPLVVDLARPTPAMGWRNQECSSFLERARLHCASGGFDLVSMLAVIHHVLVTERIPLEDVLDLADQLTNGYVLIEFVGPEDPMFQRIVRGREALYRNITRAAFEAAAEARFETVRSERIGGLHRWLYLFRQRIATN